MATLILKPSQDESLNHVCSSGNSGYLMISETTADDDTTYIYQTISSLSNSSLTSKFILSNTFPNTSFRITSAKLYIRGKSSADGIYSGSYKLSTDTISSSFSLSTSYQTSTFEITSYFMDNIYNSSNFPNISIELTTSGQKTSNKDNDFQIRITQIYLELIYEEISVENENAIYIKQDSSWVKCAAVYRKINNSWVLQSDLTSVFDENLNYIKGN